MTQPTTIGGRPVIPPPGAPVPEMLIARVRGQARNLGWSALVLIAAAGAVGFLYDNLPSPFTNVMLVLAAALIVVILVLVPFVIWLSRRYTITTRRVIAADGLFLRKRRELGHGRGYTIAVRRSPLQRLWGAGTLVLSNGVDAPLRLVNVPHARLIHEVLVDQVEVNQILAHRQTQTSTL